MNIKFIKEGLFMKYTGWIFGIAFIVIFTLGIRIFAYYRFRYDFWHPPIIAVFLMYIAYKIGAKYDYYSFMATRDILTKVYNRNYIIKNFDKKLNKALKNNQSIGVYIFDCNNFKYINDTYGHIEGDNILKVLADTLMEHKEDGDIISRWGGDEFLLVKPVRSKEKSEKRINLLHRRIKLVSKNLRTEISISVGYYICYKKITLDEAITEADKMMYERKALIKSNIVEHAAYI